MAQMPIDGWQTRRVGQGSACARCGKRDVTLYQGRRYAPAAGGWSDLPDALLCDVCREIRLDAQRAREDSPRRGDRSGDTGTPKAAA